MLHNSNSPTGSMTSAENSNWNCIWIVAYIELNFTRKPVRARKMVLIEPINIPVRSSYEFVFFTHKNISIYPPQQMLWSAWPVSCLFECSKPKVPTAKFSIIDYFPFFLCRPAGSCDCSFSFNRPTNGRSRWIGEEKKNKSKIWIN